MIATSMPVCTLSRGLSVRMKMPLLPSVLNSISRTKSPNRPLVQMSPARLKIVKTFADEGMRLRRFRAGARGRVNPFHRRFSHITVIVEEE